MASSALPNLSALRLVEAERRVDTGEWVQYDPELQTVIDNEDLQECPICALDFQKGEWLWKANRGQGRYAYYTPRKYWHALKMRNGVDPMMSDVPVPDDDVRQLVAGPPFFAGRDRDLIDDPPSSKEELDALLAQWRRARQGRAQQTRAENAPPARDWDPDDPDSVYVAFEQTARRMDVENMRWIDWMSKLLDVGLTLRSLEWLKSQNQAGALDEEGEILTIGYLQIDEGFLEHVRDVNRLANQALRWQMPFYQMHLESHEAPYDVRFWRLPEPLHDDRGVRYEWRALGGPNMAGPRASTFRLVAKMHHRSRLATMLKKRVDGMNDEIAQGRFEDNNALRNRSAADLATRGALLRGFFPDGPDAFVEWLFYWLKQDSFFINLVINGGHIREDFEFSLDVWPELMAWMCQDWPDSRPTRAGKVAAAGDDVFDYPLPRPDYADLCNYGADRPFASHLAGDWNNPQSKQLWERAVGKLSSAMTTLIRDTYEWYGSIAGWEDFELHLPDRPFRPVETSIGWRPLTYQSTDLHPVVESREMLWYAIGDGAQEE